MNPSIASSYLGKENKTEEKKREEARRKGKGREGRGREGKGREGKGRSKKNKVLYERKEPAKKCKSEKKHKC